MLLGIGVVITTSLTVFGVVWKADASQIDLAQLLQSRESSVKDDGNRATYFKATTEGNIYNKAYALAQLRVAGPAVRAVEATTEYLVNRCEAVDLTIEDVSNVLAHTDAGSLLLTTMDTQDIFGDEVGLGDFDTSCLKVIGCYYYDYLQEQSPPIAIKDLALTNNASDTCRWLVTDLFWTMQMRTSAIESLKDTNFGDELFANAEPTDAPYDLLVDIEQIGDLLFSHNDDPSEIHFYSMVPKTDYVDNDPNAITPYITKQPWREEEDRTKRRVPSIWVPLELPKLPEGTYPPSDALPESPSTQQALDQPAPVWGLQESSPGIIQNNMCIVPSLEPADPDIYELAQEEFDQTTEYNRELNLDERVAIALWAKLLPEVEEELALDPAGWEFLSDPVVQDQVDQVSSDDVLGKEWLDALEEQLKDCVEKNTNKDKGAFKKLIWKSITQPTELTLCAKKAMCKEVGGDVWTNPNLGDYRIQICKEPSKRSYAVVDNQPIVSIEEVVDEINNACLGLKESGQLIEHNKTKDQRDHGLMRVKLWEKVAFSISVSFAPVRDEEDITSEKRIRREEDDYLKKTLLGINKDLSFEKERDKYIVIAHDQPLEDIDGANAQHKRDTYTAQRDAPDNIDKDASQQLTHYAKLLDEMDSFLDYNKDLRGTINDYMHSLNSSWQGEQNEFSKKPG